MPCIEHISRANQQFRRTDEGYIIERGTRRRPRSGASIDAMPSIPTCNLVQQGNKEPASIMNWGMICDLPTIEDTFQRKCALVRIVQSL